MSHSWRINEFVLDLWSSLNSVQKWGTPCTTFFWVTTTAVLLLLIAILVSPLVVMALNAYSEKNKWVTGSSAQVNGAIPTWYNRPSGEKIVICLSYPDEDAAPREAIYFWTIVKKMASIPLWHTLEKRRKNGNYFRVQPQSYNGREDDSSSWNTTWCQRKCADCHGLSYFFLFCLATFTVTTRDLT